MGIEIAREREGSGRGYFGFDYDDEAAVADTLPAAHDGDDGDFVEYGDLPAIAVVIGGDRFAL